MTALAPALGRRQTAVPAAAVDVVLVVLGALFVAALAQFEIHLPFTPVPITAQTLGVLLVGGSLGAVRGGAAMLLYWLAGLVMPFYAGGEKGWEQATGATGGYLIGFIIAAALIGYLSERGWDRRLGSAIGAMVIGEIVVFTLGVLWLAGNLDIPVGGEVGGQNALSFGFYPYVLGDVLKVLIAAAVLPTAWRFVRDVSGRETR